MAWTPLEADLTAEGIDVVDDPACSDIIVARRIDKLKPFGHLDRIFLNWTHEPRYSLIRTDNVRVDGVLNPVHAITVHNGRIFHDCSYYGPHTPLHFDERMRAFRSKPRRAVILSTYREPRPLVFDGQDRDLYKRRHDVALLLYAKGACNIFGRNWPADVQISGESRAENWPAKKMAILADYKINIAFENTIAPFYVSEKLWDSIAGATLPVYQGAENRIYDVMPVNSFIEASEKSPEQVVDEILGMTDSEMEARYERCLRAYLSIFETNAFRRSRQSVFERTVRFIQTLTGANSGVTEPHPTLSRLGLRTGIYPVGSPVWP